MGKTKLKVLVTSDRKKKSKKLIGILNMGRRIKDPVKQARDFNIPSDEDDKQDEENKIVKTERSNPGSNKCLDEEEDDYLDEQYPPADEKYKLLEERLRAIEIQKVPGLNFDNLGLVFGVVIPPKFKTPTFSKYDGISCPKLHLRSYVWKIQQHTTDKKMWIHFFQKSLSGTSLEWFYQLDGTNIHN